MKTIRLSASVVLSILLFGLGARAQGQGTSATSSASLSDSAAASTGGVPRLVKFSGAISPQITEMTPKDQTTTSSGAPQTPAGAMGVIFSLYALPEGGAPLWTELQNVTLDAHGHYSVLLGGSTPGGLPLDLFTSGTALWLGVQPQAPDAAELPRVLLVAVPYALKASDADTLGGLPASAFLQSGSNTTDKTILTAASAKSGVANTTSPTPLPPPVLGTGTAYFLPVWLTNRIIGNSILFQNGANVGVGTTAPAATLDVNGTTNLRGLVTFAPGQTFPGTGAGTITGVTAGTGLTGGGTSGTVTLNNAGVLSLGVGPGLTTSASTGNITLGNAGILGIATGTGITTTGGQAPSLAIDTTVVPRLGTGASPVNNTFTGNQTIAGNLTVSGTVTSGNSPTASVLGCCFGRSTSSSYADPNVLGVPGPAATVNVGSSGNALVTIAGNLSTIGYQCYMAFAVSGATTVAASDNQSLEMADFSGTGNLMQASSTYMVTGLNAGSNTFTAKYKASGIGNFGCDFFNTQIIVIPY